MALKTTNFYVESMKETLPTAYAFIREIKADAYGNGVARIAVHKTRELASDPAVRPYHEEIVRFKVDRSKNDRETAYLAAKAYTPEEKTVWQGQEFVKPAEKAFFYGWEDDIV